MGEVILFVNKFDEINSENYVCRICHEEEHENCKSLESPCACSGTVKFAHRDCIQKWCDEKGNTICEICLQKFEPGYTALPKKNQLANNTVITIRGETIDVPRRTRRVRNREIPEADHIECSSTADWSAKCCRKIALTITILMLLRHVFETFTDGTEDYPFTLATLLLIRVCGIVLPMYIIIRAITAIQNSIKRLHQESINASPDSDYEDNEEENLFDHRIEVVPN